MTMGELDELIGEYDEPNDYDRAYGPGPTAAEYAEVYGPGGWTDAMISAYETYLEAAGVPNARTE